MRTRNRPDPLSPEQMQQFAVSVAGLPPQEMRQAKLLYIRNAIAELRAQEKVFASFGKMQGCLGIIPIFWPVIAMQKKMMEAQKELARQRIVNALDVWKDDLKAVGFDVSRFNLDDAGDRSDGGGDDFERERFGAEP
jgi:hypothetical protein